jgi:hypothetical protein
MLRYRVISGWSRVVLFFARTLLGTIGKSRDTSTFLTARP